MITILYTNDLHGHIGMLPRLKSLIIRERYINRDAILLDAGDLGLSGVFAEIGINVLKDYRYDAITPGNAENDFPEQWNSMRSIGAPIIAANIVRAPDNITPEPYVFRTVQGKRLAILGLTTPPMFQNTSVYPSSHPFHRSDEENAIIDSPFDVARQSIPQLRLEADIVVVLSHLGLWSDVKLASMIPGIDLIVGGHSHHRLAQPVKIGTTTIVQAGMAGAYLGVVNIDIKKNGFDITSRIEPVWQDIHEDEATKLQIRNYIHCKYPEMRTEIGYISECWANPWMENPWANLVTDTLRKYARSEIYFHKASMLIPAFDEGVATLWDLAKNVSFVLPEAGDMSSIVRMRLKGADVRGICEHSVVGLANDIDKRIRNRFVLPCNTMLQFSGICVVYDLSRAEHHRILSITVNGEPLDDQREYVVATLGFLAKGLSGFRWFEEGTHQEVIGTMRNPLLAMLQTHGRLPNIDRRLVMRWGAQEINEELREQFVIE